MEVICNDCLKNEEEGAIFSFKVKSYCDECKRARERKRKHDYFKPQKENKCKGNMPNAW